jgi:CTP:phosphocholine cytidylyltransferase-like protein
MLSFKEFEILRRKIYSKRKDFDVSFAKTIFKNEKDEKRCISELENSGFLKNGEITKLALIEMAPCKVTNAIILAAGGSDISSKSVYSMPKGLFVKNGETLIERQIRQLKEAGINDITIVIGYKQELYFFLADKWGVDLIINPDLKKNNIFSLYCALDKIKSTYICNCDNYFVNNPFSLYEYNSYHASVFKSDASNELLVKVNDSGRLLNVYSGEKTGECVFGHAYFDNQFSKRFTKYLKEEIGGF